MVALHYPLATEQLYKPNTRATIMRRFGGTKTEPAFGWAVGKVGKVQKFKADCNCEVKFGRSGTYDQPLYKKNYALKKLADIVVLALG